MAVFPFNLKCSAVIIMVSALLVAVAFAIGHDAFYQSLNGKPVLNAQPIALLNSSLNVSDQQVYLSLGTLFAFLVKVFLGVSVSTVFDQFVWKSIQTQRTRIGIIDDLLSVLKNGFTVLNLQLWKRSPISMTLALICWLLPVVSMISPATLGVNLASFDEYTLKRIPRVDFTSARFATFVSGTIPASNQSTQELWISGYRDPTPETQRVVNSVATQGTILPIEPPALNSSWSVDFHGPAIACDKVNQSVTTYITQNVAQAINGSQDWPGKTYADYSLTRYGYLSWAPAADNLMDSTPFVQNGSGIRMADQYIQLQNSLLVTGHLYLCLLLSFPHSMEIPKHNELPENVAAAVQNSTILRCTLHNASYQANLTYINGAQTIHMTDKTVLNVISYLHGVNNLDGPDLSSNTSFMHNPRVMESLSYQSIMDAFGKLLFGSISTYMTHYDYPEAGLEGNVVNSMKQTTNILSTTLMETEEMSIFPSIAGSESNSFTNYWEDRSVSPPRHFSRLSNALEELFQNITFLLMGSKMFQPNYTVQVVPNTNVTINSYRNVYVYTRSILWAAYGTALGVTALCVIAGIILYLSADGSYTTKFSTIFRVTQGAMVSIDLGMKDYSGLDPLPDHIANAQMTTGYNQDYPTRSSSRTSGL
ncbi:hypothetical protein N7465_008969 [Penicillium sp. CMV-2018d]|nr:hypothetical protein N7465_008969 [Penicillium sp. CMV-2018d]